MDQVVNSWQQGSKVNIPWFSYSMFIVYCTYRDNDGDVLYSACYAQVDGNSTSDVFKTYTPVDQCFILLNPNASYSNTSQLSCKLYIQLPFCSFASATL